MSKDNALCRPLAAVYSKYFDQGPPELFHTEAFPASGPKPVSWHFNSRNEKLADVDIYNDGIERLVRTNVLVFGSGDVSGSVLTVMKLDSTAPSVLEEEITSVPDSTIDLESGAYNSDPSEKGYVLSKYPGFSGIRSKVSRPKLETNVFESLISFRGKTYLVGHEVNFSPSSVSRIAVLTISPQQTTTDICYMTLVM